MTIYREWVVGPFHWEPPDRIIKILAQLPARERSQVLAAYHRLIWLSLDALIATTVSGNKVEDNFEELAIVLNNHRKRMRMRKK